jgi:hypothetical protein
MRTAAPWSSTGSWHAARTTGWPGSPAAIRKLLAGAWDLRRGRRRRLPVKLPAGQRIMAGRIPSCPVPGLRRSRQTTPQQTSSSQQQAPPSQRRISNAPHQRNHGLSTASLFMLLAAGTYTVAFIAFAWDLAKSSKTLLAVDLKAAQLSGADADASRVPVAAGVGSSSGAVDRADADVSGPAGRAERPTSSVAGAAAGNTAGIGQTADAGMRYSAAERRVPARVAVALTVLGAAIHARRRDHQGPRRGPGALGQHVRVPDHRCVRCRGRLPAGPGPA